LASARPTSTTAAPAKTSTTQWFAVATTANAMAAGISMENTRTTSDRVEPKRMIPTSRFQPKCRLGIAAYWFVNLGGWSVR
jgi:hypothetical protein